MSIDGAHSSTNVFDLLRWYRAYGDSENWLAATLVSRQRSSYRQPGAMMLISSLGQSCGLISGGCLEADIRHHARRVQAQGIPLCPVYDTSDEDNIAAELGLGCNGRVEVLIQELTPDHRSVLLALLERMEAGQSSYLLHCFRGESHEEMQQLALLDEHQRPVLSAMPTLLPDLTSLSGSRHQLLTEPGRSWSVNRYKPPLNFWVFGGGVDARPMVDFAARLGWRVTLVDHRIAHARDTDFPMADRILRQLPEDFGGNFNADAAVLMSHNIDIDSAWLRRLQDCESLRYLGLLGPVDRKSEVLKLAQLDPVSEFARSVRGPMGLNIGGDNPESVALSTLAECHQVFYTKDI